MGDYLNFKYLIGNISKPLKISILILLLLSIVAIVVFFVLRIDNDDKNRITVDNISQSVDTPAEYILDIENEIFDIIERNAYVNDLRERVATVREGSYSKTKNNDKTVEKYIIDIESLHYSFYVKTSWIENVTLDYDRDITITCPYYTDIIYWDKECVAEPPESQLRRYLPYYGELGEKKYGVDFKRFGDKNYVSVEVASCGDMAIAETAIESTKEWIKSLNLDPASFNIESYDICQR